MWLPANNKYGVGKTKLTFQVFPFSNNYGRLPLSSAVRAIAAINCFVCIKFYFVLLLLWFVWIALVGLCEKMCTKLIFIINDRGFLFVMLQHAFKLSISILFLWCVQICVKQQQRTTQLKKSHVLRTNLSCWDFKNG